MRLQSLTKTGDCLGFSDLHAACLRYIGIPSRACCGWWIDADQWHCINEFYLPNCGWVEADGAEDKLWYDPTGTYSFMFGAQTYRNEFCAVSRGTIHYMTTAPAFNISEAQCGWIFPSAATSLTISDSSSSQ